MKGHNIVFWDIIHNKVAYSQDLKLLKRRGVSWAKGNFFSHPKAFEEKRMTL